MNDTDNGRIVQEVYDLCFYGLTFPEAVTLVLRNKYAFGNKDTAQKLSEILNRDISPQAAANFYRKARIKITEINSTSTGAGKDLPDGADPDPPVSQPPQKVIE